MGDLLPGRMQELGQDQWLDFDSLTSVDQQSPIYNESSRVGIFYAESWALTHMLYLSPDYQDNFGKFVLALNSGKSKTATGVADRIRANARLIFADLRSYFDRKKIFRTGLRGEHSRNPRMRSLLPRCRILMRGWHWRICWWRSTSPIRRGWNTSGSTRKSQAAPM